MTASYLSTVSVFLSLLFFLVRSCDCLPHVNHMKSLIPFQTHIWQVKPCLEYDMADNDRRENAQLPSKQLWDSSTSDEQVEPRLQELCATLFGTQMPNGNISEHDRAHLATVSKDFILNRPAHPSADTVTEAVILLKSLLLGVSGDPAFTKKIVKRLDKVLLPTVFMKTNIRPSHLRNALQISPESITKDVERTLTTWRESNQWDFLPSSHAAPSHANRLTSSNKENTNDSTVVAGASAASHGTKALAVAVASKSKQTGMHTHASSRGIRPHPTSTNVVPTRGIPSYLITKRGTRASTPPPQEAPQSVPVYASALPSITEDSNSTLVLESPVKRRRVDCYVVPPSPQRDSHT